MRVRHRATILAAFATLGAVACGRGGSTSKTPEGAFRAASPGSALDPTVRPSRLVPEQIEETTTYGSESSGGTRVLAGGLRLVSSSQGALVAAGDRLPTTPLITTALPERLGGGFLFLLGTTVWRADKWLAPAAPVFTSPQAVQAIVPGLDRVYLRTQSGHVAIDGVRGTLLDRGPWPASPNVTSYAAADGWRAVATADLRGVVATFDAGATWRTLDLAIEPRTVVASGDALAVGGVDGARGDAWFEVRADGSIARLVGAPRDAKGLGPLVRAPTTVTRPGFPTPWPSPTSSPGARTMPIPPKSVEPGEETPEAGSDPARDPESASARIFGPRPVVAAIEDGWPLTDGTAVIARDGALARVRLSDGALVEVAHGAFPLKPSRCHPVSLTRANAVGAFGFVCGEQRGLTVIYAYEPLRGRVAEIKRFDRPRVVTSSGNGALAVHGGCAEDAVTSANGPQAYCVLGHDNTWREVVVRGDVVGERVVVLADGRLAVVSPPPKADAPARLTLLDKGKATTVPIVFPRVSADVGRVLRLGLWLDGFEERRPGVLGGWIEAAGTMLGVEIATDGKATLGQFVRDAGQVFVAGRYGLGWGGSRRGYETTDGGMTWSSLELPEPMPARGRPVRRACGPVGCLASGWARVGWGEPKRPPVPVAPPITRTNVTLGAPTISLSCDALAGVAPPPPAPAVRRTKEPSVTRPGAPTRFGGPPVLAPTSSQLGAVDLPAFYSQPGPALRDGERGLSFDVGEQQFRTPRSGSLARVYTWGPKTGDWDTLGRWQVRWLSPFAGWPETKTSVASLPPSAILDMTRTSSPFGYGSFSYGNGAFQVSAADDASHALLALRRVNNRNELTLFELEADRAAVEIRRADGEPFPELDGAVRAAGRWFVAITSTSPLTAPQTTIWQIDGAVAREIAHVPRVGLDTGRALQTRLARRSDGRALGLVVDGQPTPERTNPVRWVLPIDLETGALGEPESLGYDDLAGLALDACADDAVGWVLDTNIPSSVVRLKVGASTGSVHSALARLRLTGSRACIERVSGMLDGQSTERATMLTKVGARGGPLRPGEIGAAIVAGGSRYPLRCSLTR